MLHNARFIGTRTTVCLSGLLPRVHPVASVRNLHSDKTRQTASAIDSEENEGKRISDASKSPQPKSKPLTMAERDAELMARMEERSGDGGSAGLELEDGQAPAMKRGVRENMFRLI